MIQTIRIEIVLRRTLLILTLFLLAACGGGGSAQPTKGDVIVYVAVPLSGFQANGGQTVLGGVHLAAEEVNRNGGLLGYRVVVRPLDDESDSDTALANVDAIRDAINSGERVLGVIGHLNSGQTDATLGEYDSLGLITITPTASEESLTNRGFTRFFRVNANDSVQAKVNAQFLMEEMQARNVAVVHNDTDYGKGLAASLASALGQLGGVEALRVEVAEGESNYAPVLAQLQSSAVDALFYAGYEIEAPYLAAALREAGVNLPILASDGAFLAATIDEANGAAEGMYVSAFAPSPENAADPKWIEAYQAVEYRNPDTYSVNGYVAMQVLAEGVKAADSLGADEIAAALRSKAIPTVLGEMRFDEKGDLANPQIWIYRVENDEFRQVK